MNNFEILKSLCDEYKIPHDVISMQSDNESESSFVKISRNGKNLYSRYGFLSVFPNTAFTHEIAKSKWLTTKFLALEGISTPASLLVTNDSLVDPKITSNLKYPFVLKPYRGARGLDVSIINSLEQLTAVHSAADKQAKWLIEEYIEGQEFRVLLYKGTVLCWYKRESAHILGDGTQTLATHLDNTDINSQVRAATKEKYKDRLDEVLPLGAKINMLQATNLTRGGSYSEVNQTTTPQLETWAQSIYKAVPLCVCGIDVISTSGDLNDIESLKLIEINADPSLSVPFEHFGSGFVFKRVWEPILEEYFG